MTDGRAGEGGRPRVALILGPTGIGKTALAVRLANELGAELISADSMAVYRKMDIGTAKPTPKERAQARHHLIDIVDPDEPFSAADFQREARAIIDDLHSRGVPAVVVGGTGLYVRALVHGLFEGPPADLELRARLEAREDAQPGWLHSELGRVDARSAERLHPRDRLRLVRALEVAELTGRTLTAWFDAHRFTDEPYETLKVVLTQERQPLIERIEARVDRMMDEGLLHEVRGLLDAGYGPELKPMRALGYEHMCSHLVGGVPLGEAVRALKADTRRFSRRQMTWMRSEPNTLFMQASDQEAARSRVTQFLKGLPFDAT